MLSKKVLSSLPENTTFLVLEPPRVTGSFAVAMGQNAGTPVNTQKAFKID